MNVKKRCGCEGNCDHPYHFKFKHKGRPYRESTNTANYKLACRIAQRRHTAVVGKVAGVGSDEPIRARLSELVTKYEVFAAANHAPNVAVRTVTIIHSFRAFFPDDPFIVDIEAFDIERWRSQRLKTGVARSTVQCEYFALKGMFREAAIWYPGYERPDAHVKCWKLDDPVIAILTDEELRYTLTNLPPILSRVCRVTLETLARLSEVLALTTHDLGPDWMTRRLKGGKRLRTRITPTLAADLRAALRPGQVNLFEDDAQRPGVFRQLDGDATSLRFYRWFRAHKLDHLHHHCYRHTGITMMLEGGGINPRVIQTLAGWTSLAMLKRYGHVRDAEMTRAVQGNADALTAILTAPDPAAQPAAQASGGHIKGHTATGGVRK